MDIEEILKAEGYTDEESKELMENPKHKGLLTKILAQSEEGTTALLKAQELEQDIRKFNDETVIPYGAKKDAEAAAARAEAAKYQTYLKSLKDAGYDIPDAYLAAAPEKPEVKPAEPKYVQAEDLDKQGRAYMSLLTMSEKARDLLGHGLDIEQEYDDFGKNRRPNENMREYVSRKYDFGAKEKERAEKKAADEKSAIEAAAIERYKRDNPQTSNPELRTPQATKFDKFQKLPDAEKNSWQTQAGREQAAQRRMDKYKDLLVQ